MKEKAVFCVGARAQELWDTNTPSVTECICAILYIQDFIAGKSNLQFWKKLSSTRAHLSHCYWSCITLQIFIYSGHRINGSISLFSPSLYFHVTQISCWMQHYPLCWRFFYGNFHKWFLYFLCCYSVGRKAIILFRTESRLQCWNCQHFSKWDCSIWNALGLILSIFIRLLPWCMLSTSVRLTWVLSCTQKAKAHTTRLSQGKELSHRMSLAETSTEPPVFFCCYFLPLPLQGLLGVQEVMQVPCALPIYLLC